MIRLIGLWLVVCALCVTPVAADEDVHDGPTAIKPLTVTPKPQQSAPPNTVCDFEQQCYPEKGGPVVKAPVAPPVVATKPAAPRPTVPDDPLVAAWRDCTGQALQNYEQSHNIHALQAATGSCQVRLEAQGDENFAGVEPPMPADTARGARWTTQHRLRLVAYRKRRRPRLCDGGSPLLTTASGTPPNCELRGRGLQRVGALSARRRSSQHHPLMTALDRRAPRL